MLKKIGTKAREDMERFFDCKVNLQLWVKVKEDWRPAPRNVAKPGLFREGPWRCNGAA